MVEAASSRRGPVLGGPYGSQISLTAARDGEDGHQYSHVLGGSQQGAVPPLSEGVRPASGDQSAGVSPQPESSSRPSWPEPQQRAVECGLILGQDQ